MDMRKWRIANTILLVAALASASYLGIAVWRASHPTVAHVISGQGSGSVSPGSLSERPSGPGSVPAAATGRVGTEENASPSLDYYAPVLEGRMFGMSPERQIGVAQNGTGMVWSTVPREGEAEPGPAENVEVRTLRLDSDSTRTYGGIVLKGIVYGPDSLYAVIEEKGTRMSTVVRVGGVTKEGEVLEIGKDYVVLKVKG